MDACPTKKKKVSEKDPLGASLTDECYKLAVGLWGIQPSEFLRMTDHEFWLLYEVKMKSSGKMTYSDYEELKEFMYG
jgi:hypothetical protein